MKRIFFILILLSLLLSSCTNLQDISITTDSQHIYIASNEEETSSSPPTDNIFTTTTLESNTSFIEPQLSEIEKRVNLIKALEALPQNLPPEQYDDMPLKVFTVSDKSPDSFVYTQISASQLVEYGLLPSGSKRNIKSSICFPRLKSTNEYYGGPACINERLGWIKNKYNDIIYTIENGIYTGQKVWDISYSASVKDNVAVVVLHVAKSLPDDKAVVISYPFYYNITENIEINPEEYLSCFGYVPEELIKAVAAQLREKGVEYDDPFMEQIEYLVYNGDKRFTVVLREGVVSDEPVTLELEVSNTFLGDLKRTYNKALDFNNWTSWLYSPDLDVFYHVTHDIDDPEAVVKPYEPDNNPYWYNNPPSPLEYKGGYYYKVNEPSISDYNSLENYISDIFPPIKVSEIIHKFRQTTQESVYDYKSFTEIDGMLWYMVDKVRDADISYGRASYYLKELTDMQAFMTAKVAFHEEILDSEGIYLYTTYDFVYFDIVFELIDNKWLITTFPTIW